ncbi:MAG: GMC oxidoreductase [Dermatophilaceae bacterium]
MTTPRAADVVVVGSGLVGAVVAATVSRLRPSSSVLVLERGRPDGGSSLRRLSPAERHERDLAMRDPLAIAIERASSPTTGLENVGVRSGYGGTGGIWSGAAPLPLAWERPDFLRREELERRLAHGQRALGVVSPASTVDDRSVLATRTAVAEACRARRQPPAAMPLAVSWPRPVTPIGTHELLTRAPGPVLARRGNQVQRVLFGSGGRTRAVNVLNLASGTTSTVHADVVVVAANAFRTPQLLFSSGVENDVIGRHLHEHPLVTAAGVRPGPTGPALGADTEPHALLRGTTWLPAEAGGDLAHGQVLHMPGPAGAPLSPEAQRGADVVVFGWYCHQDVNPENRLDFSDGCCDDDGMPVPQVVHRRSSADSARVQDSVGELEHLEDAGVVAYLPHHRPRPAPSGMSAHYLGTVRMGVDPAESVCSESGEVWGHPGLLVAGTGVIGWPTAGNPTLTAVAHARRAAERVVELLG